MNLNRILQNSTIEKVKILTLILEVVLNLLIYRFKKKQGNFFHAADLVFSSTFLKSKPIYQNSGDLK